MLFKTIQMQTGSFRKRITVASDDGIRQDSRRNANGLSPNITHSWDSAHMAMTTEGLRAHGVASFAGVHDSFGVLPNDADALFNVVRQKFVELYENFSTVRELQRVFREATGCELPSPPTQGSLDIRDVLQNNFAFA